jgi:hypothetical protein
MLLRDHPLMTFHSARSCHQSGRGATGPKLPKVGILKDVKPSYIQPYNRCFLIMEHRGAEYVGTLLLNDPAFCREIYGMLIQHRGKAIQAIGDIDLSPTL